MKKSLIVLLVFSLFPIIGAFAQKGTVKGVIKDEVTEEGVIGASVVIKGTTTGGSTEIDGSFTFQADPGTYTLVLTSIGFEEKELEGVKVSAGKTTVINNTMGEDVEALADVVVTATRITNTSAAVIQEVRESEQVVSAVSAEEISKTQDGNAAQVIKRIPGVTIIDGRYVVVRGLSQRYNSVMLNGVYAPSTETDQRAFSFDVIPSSMLDRILVYKSGSPDLPGEFAGANVKLYTRNNVEENFMKLSGNLGYRVGTTFNTLVTDPHNDQLDIVGLGILERKWPSNFEQVSSNAILSGEQAKLLDNNFTTDSRTALPNGSLSFSIGRKVYAGDVKISNITYLGYSRSNLIYNRERFSYINYQKDESGEINSSSVEYQSMDNYNKTTTKLGLLHNWSAVFSPKFKLEFHNLLTQRSESEVVVRRTSQFFLTQDRIDYSLQYDSRLIYTGQLSGTHEFNDFKSKLVWTAGLSYMDQQLPDWRRARLQRDLGTENPYRVIIQQNSLDALSRFNLGLDQTNLSQGVQFEHQLTEGSDGEKGIVLKAGYQLEKSDRNFAARWTSYKRSPGDRFDQSISSEPLETILDPENLGFPNGLILSEGTAPSDTYNAGNTLYAGYVGLNIPMLHNKLNVSGGARMEAFNQRISSPGINEVTKLPTDEDTTYVNILPSANLSYNFSEKFLARLAYSRTVNRPSLRELAPFAFFDFNLLAVIIGNPNLVQATIDNYDLRFEYYPSPEESVSVGFFYKDFTNPIERYIKRTDNTTFVYDNAQSSTSYGVEVDLRKSLKGLTEAGVIDDLSVLVNASYIRSEIQLGKNSVEVSKNRALQGQSPYIINLGMFYEDDESGLNATLQYNVYGKRIFSAGDGQNSYNFYEMPMNLLDLSMGYEVNEHLDVKFGIVNILNAQYQLLEDQNSDSRLDNDAVDRPILQYRKGQEFTVGASYTF